MRTEMQLSSDVQLPLVLCHFIQNWNGERHRNVTAQYQTSWTSRKRFYSFDVLLTVHLSIFILVINQLEVQNLFYNKFISCLYMFRARCAHRQEVKIVLYSLWYHHTYRCDEYIITPIGVMSTWCSKHAEAWNKLIVKQILCIKLVNY